MNDIAPEFKERLSVRPKCEHCPLLGRLGLMYDGLTHATNEFAEAILAGNVDSMLKSALVESGMPEDEAVEVLLANSGRIHDENVAAINDLDEQRDAHVTLGEKILSYCSEDGALTMRATRNGEQVTVTVCMSDAVNIVQALGIEEPTRVRRKMVDGF